MPDSQTIIMALVLLTGTGVFLRLVGKEKYRREKHLQLRVIEKANELKVEEEKRKARAEKGEKEKSSGGERQDVLTVMPTQD